MSDQTEHSRASWMMDRCKLFGKLGMILCWYWDVSKKEENYGDAIRGVSLLPDLLSGHTEHFTRADWWTFMDAVGSYLGAVGVVPELLNVYEIAKDGYEGKLTGPTLAFDGWEDDDDVSGI